MLWLCIGWHVTWCIIMIFVSAVAFSRNAAIVSPSAQPGPPGAPTGTMESTKAERSAEPKTKEELREAAKRARAEAARYDILADAQREQRANLKRQGGANKKERNKRYDIIERGEETMERETGGGQETTAGRKQGEDESIYQKEA